MATTVMRSIQAEGRRITYQLEYKPVKNINLRVRKDGSVYVSANKLVALTEVDTFVQSKGNFILRAIDRFAEIERLKPQPKQYVSGETFYLQGRGLRLHVTQGAKDTVSSDGVYIHLSVKNPDDITRRKQLVTRFLDKECKRIFSAVLDDLYPVFQKYGIAMPTLRIRDMDTRWGSCLPKKGIVTLNKRLVEAPRNCIEYVAMHELCHFTHPNHSKQFYAFLSMLMPDWKERKALLDKTVTY